MRLPLLACLCCTANLGAQTASDTDRAAVPRALIEFIVAGPDGTPLDDVTLKATLPGGMVRSIITNAAGRAQLADVPPGVVQVEVRRVGFKPGDVVVRIEAGRSTVPIRLSLAALPALDTVRIMAGRRANGRLDEFEARHLRHEATASLDAAEIATRDPLETWQLFRAVPGVRILAEPDGAMRPMSSRGLAFETRKVAPCYLSVFINGVAAEATFDLRLLPPPRELYGVEVFAGAASVPLRYSAASLNDRTCGVIAIWTK